MNSVVFVADSAPNRMRANIGSWQSLAQHLRSYKIPIAKFPVVVQGNKQDLPNALSTTKVAQMLRATAYPLVPAVAMNGGG